MSPIATGAICIDYAHYDLCTGAIWYTYVKSTNTKTLYMLGMWYITFMAISQTHITSHALIPDDDPCDQAISL